MDTGSPYMGQPGGEGFNTGAPVASATYTSGVIGQLEAVLDEYLVRKAPFHLPMNVKEIIVKIVPFVVLILAILAIPVVLAAVGLSAMFAPAAMMGGYSMGVWGLLTGVLTLVYLVLELMSVPGLFKRTRSGWKFAFYASIVSLIASIVSMAIISGIIGAIIGWYFLFQVKDMYH